MRQRSLWLGGALAAVLLASVVLVWNMRGDRSVDEQAADEHAQPPAAEIPAVVEPPPAPVFASEYYRDVKPILDRRCLVCHAGYDAPCQLRLDSPDGLQRGATRERVYDPTRTLPAALTRLFVDAKNVAEWRDKGFHPVLAEGAADAAVESVADPLNSVLYRMLALKREHALADTKSAADADISARSADTCPRLDDFAAYAAAHPSRGMPLALPGLDADEFAAVQRWLEGGAKVAAQLPLPADLQKAVVDWERFLNNDDLKSRLMSRYLYEHLFLADLYFGAREPRQFFRLVRSRTGSGPIDVIASRHPTDDPDMPRVFYRLQPVQASVAAKTHLPYLLDDRRMARWRELFLKANYSLDRLPAYAPEIAGNPFVAFAALPVNSRYRFLLDDAAFFLRNFAQGPAGRSELAVGALQERFWVAFASPDQPALVDADFLARASADLWLPADGGDKAGTSRWRAYGERQAAWVAAKDRFLQDRFGTPHAASLDQLWDGDGSNGNAALTVFRHFDSVSVMEGLVGDTPKTAWVVDYPMLERICYQLGAGFDIYGTADQQAAAGLYMDYLRMEGEANFLAFLPRARREAERNAWYRGTGAKLRDSPYRKSVAYRGETGIDFHTKNTKREFFERLRGRIGPALAQRRALDSATLEAPTRAALRKIGTLHGWPASYLPELVYLRVVIRGAPDQVFTLVHDVDRDGVALSSPQKARRRPQADAVTVVPGIVGAYPRALWVVKDSDLPLLAKRLASLDGRAAWRRLQRDFGVARTDPKFWQHSDWLHNIYRESEPVEWGALDFSRYEN